MSSTYPHNMMNFGLLTAELRWRVWGTPRNFNLFCVLTSLVQRRRSTEVNKTVQNVWPWPGLVHYIYIFFWGGRGYCPLTEFASCKIHFASKSCVLLYWKHYCMALEQWASAKLCGVVQGIELRNFRRGRYLYSAAGRPSRWAYILVEATLQCITLGSLCNAICKLAYDYVTDGCINICRPIYRPTQTVCVGWFYLHWWWQIVKACKSYGRSAWNSQCVIDRDVTPGCVQ